MNHQWIMMTTFHFDSITYNNKAPLSRGYKEKKMKEVTGRIENWSYNKKQNVIVGDLYDDIHGRWKDGQFIQTSSLLPMSMQVSSPREGVKVSTLNSTYLLGKKK